MIKTEKWDKVFLGEIADEITVRVDNPSQSGFEMFVGLAHFVSGDLKIKQWGSTKNLVSAMKKFQKGDILFARRNAYLKRASMVEFDGVCSGDAFVVREKKDKLVPGFLAFIFNSESLWYYANSYAAGTMSKRVKWRDLAKYSFKLPPLDEQKRLADLLWSVDEVIEKYNIVFSTLDCLCKSYAFQEFSGNNNKCIFLKETIELFKGKQPNKLYSDSKEGRLPYLTTDYIRNGISQFVDVSSSVDENNLAGNSDILLLWDGSNAGETFLGYRGVVASTMAKIKIVANEVLPEYLYFYLRLNEDVIKRARIGSAIPHVSADFLLHLKFPVKKLNDQQKFVNKISDFENQKNMVNSSNIILRKVQKQIINQIFR